MLPRRRRVLQYFTLVAGSWVAACSDGPAEPNAPAALQLVLGDEQIGAAGTALGSVSVRVLDGANQPIRGVPVAWSVTGGGGTIAPDTSITDGSGVAHAVWTLGSSLGDQFAAATVAGLASLPLRAFATAGPPAVLLGAHGDAQEGTVAESLSEPLVVSVTDALGHPVSGATVYWTVGTGGGTVSPAASTTDEAGLASTSWTLGTLAGAGHRARAVVGGAPAVAAAEFTATARAGAAATIRILPDSAATFVGQPVQFSSSVEDAFGNPITDRTPVWSVLIPAVAAIDAAGSVQPAAPGLTGVTASLDGRTTTAPLRVLAVTAPTITAISPEVLGAGELAVISGTGFSPVATSNTVHIGGVAATVVSAGTTSLTVRVPPGSAFPCAPEGPVEISVSVPNLGRSSTHRLEVARPLSLAVGETKLLLAEHDAACNLLDARAGAYLVAVINTATTATAEAPFTVRGALSGAAAEAPLVASAGRRQLERGPLPRPGASAAAFIQAPASVPVPPFSGRTAGGSAGPSRHLDILEQGRRLYAQRGAPPRLPPQVRGAVAAFTAPPAVGTVLGLRFPGFDDVCQSFSPLQARVVYSGSTAIVLEELGNALAGSADNHYRALGTEFDERIMPLLLENFGDPLAMDAQLDGNGRILILFTPRVNELGVGGFVSSADFYPTSTCAASNVGEIMYLPVPSDANDIATWYRVIQSVLAHEGKHIASVGERIARGAAVLEEVWLEESTARIAEELWARLPFGYSQHGNATYLQSLRCELLCSGRPFVMWNHLFGVYDYFSNVNFLSPLGPVFPGDPTFYGSGWLLVRWVLDHAPTSESAFLRALTRETSRAGVANLEARAATSFAELLSRWALSLFTDDLPLVADPQLQHPSWDLYDLFLGMNTDFPVLFPTPFPLVGWAREYGSFSVNATVRGGSAAFIALFGDQAQQQLLELQRAAGAGTLRLAIVRID